MIEIDCQLHTSLVVELSAGNPKPPPLLPCINEANVTSGIQGIIPILFLGPTLRSIYLLAGYENSRDYVDLLPRIPISSPSLTHITCRVLCNETNFDVFNNMLQHLTRLQTVAIELFGFDGITPLINNLSRLGSLEALRLDRTEPSTFQPHHNYASPFPSLRHLILVIPDVGSWVPAFLRILESDSLLEDLQFGNGLGGYFWFTQAPTDRGWTSQEVGENRIPDTF